MSSESTDVESDTNATPENVLNVEKIESGTTSVEFNDDQTLPSILISHTEEYPNEVALRWKRSGVWREFTWEEYYQNVKCFTLGLQEIGFSADDILFTIGYNRPQQTWAWLGAISLNGMAAPNYEEDHPEEIRKQLDLLKPSIAYAEDQQTVDKLLETEAPYLDKIIYRDSKGLSQYNPENVTLHSYEEVKTIGQERLETGNLPDDYYDNLVSELMATETAILTPTSGTTGTPKRVKLTHSNFINMARGALETDPLPRGTDYFSILPMAWIGEQMIQMAIAFRAGWITNFPEGPETEMEDLREIGPEMFITSPNTYTQWVADIKANIENTTRLKRWVYQKTMEIGNRYAEYKIGDKRDEDIPTILHILHSLSYWVSYRPILDKIGLKRGQNIYTGGAPLGEDHFRFFHALGVPLKQLWGQTEVCGFVTLHDNDDIRVDTVGKVLPNVEVGIRSNGELLVRGSMVTDGYYKQPDKTESAFEDGWLHTDDFGEITDDGHVKVLDRMDDVMTLQSGTDIAPIRIETKLKFNPYIKEAVAIGDEREYITAMVNIRYNNVAEWADQHNIQYTGYQDLASKPELLELIADAIKEVNNDLEVELQIRRFVVLFKELDPDDGELTRTGKLRREIIADRYNEVIESMYDQTDSIKTSVEITYQDGQKVTEEGEMDIISIEEGDYQIGGRQ